MGNTKKRYSADIKRTAVEEIVNGGKSMNAVARELGVAPNTVRTWVLKFNAGGLFKDPLSSREKALAKENEKLKTTVGDLYVQLELLKKAVHLSRQKQSAATSIITAKNLAQFKKGAK